MDPSGHQTRHLYRMVIIEKRGAARSSLGEGGDERTTDKVMGVVVDGVSDVCNVELDGIRAAPDFRGVISSDFVTGLTTSDEKMIVLLDIDHLINMGIMTQLDAALAA